MVLNLLNFFMMLCWPLSPLSFLIGGYQLIPNNSSMAVDAALFAMSETYGNSARYFTVLKAESQVVAGINYKLLVSAGVHSPSTSDNTSSKEFCVLNEFVVFKSLPLPTSTYSLTHRETSPLECSDLKAKNSTDAYTYRYQYS